MLALRVGSVDHMIRWSGRKYNRETPSGPANSLMTAIRYHTVPDYMKWKFENRAVGSYRKYVSDESFINRPEACNWYKKKMH